MLIEVLKPKKNTLILSLMKEDVAILTTYRYWQFRALRSKKSKNFASLEEVVAITFCNRSTSS